MTPTEPTRTPLAGESATLEERLREYADSKTMLEDVPGEPDGIEICGWCGQTWPEHDPAGCIAQTVADAHAELARLTADVARLTAANERLERWKKIVTEAPETADRLALAEQVRPIVAVWKDRLEVAEARAERYRVALEAAERALMEHEEDRSTGWISPLRSWILRRIAPTSEGAET